MNFITLLVLIALTPLDALSAQNRESDLQPIYAPLSIQDTKNNDLMFAIQDGNLEEITARIEDGADINALNISGDTSLSAAVAAGHLPIVQFLLKNGVNANIANNAGVTPLYRAVIQNDLALVKELLKVSSVNVNLADDEGVTPLFIAACENNLDIIKELLKRTDLVINPLTHEELTPADAAENPTIQELLEIRGGINGFHLKLIIQEFIKAVNTGDVDLVAKVITPQNTQLKNDILSKIKDGFEFKMPDFTVHIITPHKVKVSGTFNAKGPNWELNGFPIYFILEKTVDNWWRITETDFTKKLSSGFFGSFFLLIFAFVIFWLWMLIDCVKRKFPKRTLWIIMLVLLNFAAAVVYFFVIKRKDFTSRI